jgi:hypothetical protein
LKKGSVRQYFPGSNSCEGFYSLWDYNVNNLEKLIILKGGPGTGKSTFLSYVTKEMTARGHNTELLWCSSDADSLDGVIFRDIGIGIVDGTAPHLRDPKYPGVVDKLVNLGNFWNEELLLESRTDIINLTDQNKELYRKTYAKMKEAKEYHDKLEQLYMEGMNWSAIDKMTDQLINDFFGAYPDNKDGGLVQEIRRFAGASTPQGPVNYLDELLSGATRKFILKGRAGTGKSTLTKKIAQAANEKGFTVEYYHCSFDPHSIDNIYIPKLGICLIDGTPPHEKDPGPDDTVLDMFKFMSEKVYRKNLSKIEETDANYQHSFLESLDILKECKAVHDELEKCYVKAMSFKEVDHVREMVLEEILAFAGKLGV